MNEWFVEILLKAECERIACAEQSPYMTFPWWIGLAFPIIGKVVAVEPNIIRILINSNGLATTDILAHSKKERIYTRNKNDTIQDITTNIYSFTVDVPKKDVDIRNLEEKEVFSLKLKGSL